MSGIGFVHSLRCHGNAPAILADDGDTVSYAVLAELVDARLAELGPERRLVLLEARLDLATVVTYLAALKGRHPVLMAAPDAPARTRELAATFRPGQPGGLHPDLAVLLSTSGSTGSGKLVRLSAANIDANARSIAAFLELGPGDRGALTLPLHYSYGLSVLNSHLHAGASIFLRAASVAEEGFIEAIGRAGCTNLSGVPYSYELFERIGLREHALPALRFMTVAGGRLAPETVRLYARYRRLFVMYGQTEATARIAFLPPEAALTHADCIGQAIPGGALEIEHGELVYRGPNVMMGYAIGRADLARGAELDRLRTGDLAERDASGFFRVTGRLNRFSKIAGLRLGHDEIERRLAREGIAATVTGDDTRLVAAVTGGTAISAVQSRIAAITGLPSLRIDVTALTALPRQASGKIDYPALRALVPTGREDAACVREAFAQAFYPAPVTPRDSFASLGGDSLTYVQLSLSLERLLGTLPDDWDRRPIAELAPLARRRGLLTWIDTDIVLRGLAIVLIVLHHTTLWPLPGGAATLFLLVGFSLARFQRDSLAEGRAGEVWGRALRNISLYYPVLIGYCLYTGQFLWPSLLLIGTTGIGDYPVANTPLIVYWFIEAYAQIMLVLGLICLIPAARRAVAARPFGAGVTLLVFSFAMRLSVFVLFERGPLLIYSAPMVFYLPILGWCIYFADTAARRLTLSLAVLGIAASFLLLEGPWPAVWVKGGVLVFAALVLLWCPRLPLPRLAGVALGVVAAASFHIYLLHTIPLHMMLTLGLDYDSPLRIVPSYLLSLGIGIAAWSLHQAVRRRWMWRQTSVLLPNRERVVN